MLKSDDLSRLKTGLELIENQEDKQCTLNAFFKFKPTTPFSRNLNNFIEQMVKNIELCEYAKFVYVEHDDFNEDDLKGTFLRHYKRFKDTGEIHVWTGASDKTIFGDPTINHKFRAWNDYIHLTNNLGYDAIGESIVCDIQKEQLPDNFIFERELLHIEVAGQIHYHALNHAFVEDQRQFTIDYLLNPLKALRDA
mgnify:CR=1 FL=1